MTGVSNQLPDNRESINNIKEDVLSSNSKNNSTLKSNENLL